MKKLLGLFLISASFCFCLEDTNNIKEISMTNGSSIKGDIKNTLTSRIENLEGRVADIEQKTVTDKYEGKTLITRCNEDENTIALYGDFLWWKAENAGFRYAIDAVDRKYQIINHKFDWDPGFRIGLGYNSCFDGWDIYALWTRFHNKSSKITRKITTATQGLLPEYFLTVPVYFVLDATPHIGYCKAVYGIDYDTAEIIFDRDFFIGKSLAIKPYFAAKVLFLDQKFDVDYQDPVATFESYFPATVRISLDQWGAGPKIGMDTSWYLLKNLKLYANFATDLAYGKKKLKIQLNSPNENARFDSTYNQNTLIPTLNLALGAAFTYCFNDSTSLNLHMAWETVYLWNQFIANSFPSLSFNLNLNEPLNMQGITTGAEIRF